MGDWGGGRGGSIPQKTKSPPHPSNMYTYTSFLRIDCRQICSCRYQKPWIDLEGHTLHPGHRLDSQEGDSQEETPSHLLCKAWILNTREDTNTQHWTRWIFSKPIKLHCTCTYLQKYFEDFILLSWQRLKYQLKHVSISNRRPSFVSGKTLYPVC